jgi:hypothetical protein
MQLSAAAIKKSGRSRITNGSALLPGVDQRSTWVRRCRDIINAHVADLGGDDNCTTAEKSIVRRAAVLTTALETFEVKFAKAGQASGTDLDLYSRTASNLRRLLESVGLERRPKNITTSVSEYLASKREPVTIDQTNETSDGTAA